LWEEDENDVEIKQGDAKAVPDVGINRKAASSRY
jgi:hypothetical protein